MLIFFSILYSYMSNGIIILFIYFSCIYYSGLIFVLRVFFWIINEFTETNAPRVSRVLHANILLKTIYLFIYLFLQLIYNLYNIMFQIKIKKRCCITSRDYINIIIIMPWSYNWIPTLLTRLPIINIRKYGLSRFSRSVLDFGNECTFKFTYWYYFTTYRTVEVSRNTLAKLWKISIR